MALRRPSGVYVRNTWDWLREGNFLAACNVASFAVGSAIYFVNQGMGANAYDLYRLECETNPNIKLGVQIFSNVTPTNPIAGITLAPLDPTFPPPAAGIFATPPAIAGTAQFGFNFGNLAQNPLMVELANGGPFYRLYPNWAIAVINSDTVSTNLGFHLFAQQISE